MRSARPARIRVAASASAVLAETQALVYTRRWPKSRAGGVLSASRSGVVLRSTPACVHAVLIARSSSSSSVPVSAAVAAWCTRRLLVSKRVISANADVLASWASGPRPSAVRIERPVTATGLGSDMAGQHLGDHGDGVVDG
jgi:hypothetical protein